MTPETQQTDNEARLVLGLAGGTFLISLATAFALAWGDDHRDYTPPNHIYGEGHPFYNESTYEN